jgi:hypothetical protein
VTPDPADDHRPSDPGDAGDGVPVAGKRPSPGPAGGRTGLVVVTVAWLALAIGCFFELWLLAWLWVGAWAVLGGLWVVAVTATLVVVGRLVGAAVLAAASATLVVTVGAGTAIALTNWASAFAHGWYTVHRSAFVETAARADSGAFGPLDDWPYYGVELPASLRSISVTGDVARVGGVGDRAVLLVPAYVGIPDGAVGFARIPPGRPEVIDGFGDPLTPRFPLGDDWWWVA